MNTTRFLIAACAAIGIFISPASSFAIDEKELKEIQQQIQALKNDYEAKIKSLEARLEAAEQTAKAAETKVSAAQATVATTAAAPPPPSPPIQPTAPAAAGAFNPAVSAVLNGTYGQFSRNPDKARIHGFALGPDASPGTRGFSLDETEVDLAANIDQALYGSLTLSIHPDDTVGVEEGYIQTTSLPWGFTVKAGRFLSGIGYLNEKHAHAWDFVDAPLPYRALLNTQYGDDGVQVKWLATTEWFLEFGAEAFRGDAFPAANGPGHGKGAWSLFAHTGADINDSSSWLAGLSYLQTRADDRGSGDDIFSGHDHIGIASLVYKWAPAGNPTQRNLIVNGEYFYGRELGTFDGSRLNQWRDGWYVQGVYQFMPRWRVGLRHDEVDSEHLAGAFAGGTLDNLGHTPRRNTALLEYDTSEFARFRLQYSRDDADVFTDDEVLLTYDVTYGPHGAHRF